MRCLPNIKFCKDSYAYTEVFYFKSGKFSKKKLLSVDSVRLSFIRCDSDNNFYKVKKIKKDKLSNEKF